MKKHIIITLIFVSIVMPTNSQELNQTIKSERSNSVILIGYGNRDAFSLPEFQGWFDETYEVYLPMEDVLEMLAQKDLNQITITIVMATWCPDSRREIPAFYRILDDLSFPDESITLINVNTEKKFPGEDLSSLNVAFVPTFIIYRNGEEIGRIIESPDDTLEEDMLVILSD